MVEREAQTEQSIGLLAVAIVSFQTAKASGLAIPAGSSLAPLSFKATNALLPPLRSHLQSSCEACEDDKVES